MCHDVANAAMSAETSASFQRRRSRKCGEGGEGGKASVIVEALANTADTPFVEEGAAFDAVTALQKLQQRSLRQKAAVENTHRQVSRFLV